jgi:hypothetical protein
VDHPNQPQSLLHPKLDLVPKVRFLLLYIIRFSFVFCCLIGIQGHITPFQIHRAAGFITNTLNMKEAIER